MMTIHTLELQLLITKRLKKAKIPAVLKMSGWTEREIRDFNSMQEIIMKAVWDQAVKTTKLKMGKK